MNGLVRALVHRILSLFRRRRLDHDFRDELAAHLDLAVEDHIRAGLSPDEARRRAVLRLGGIEPIRERQREAHGLPALESVARDVIHACRSLRRHAGFAAMAVGILALGIGGTTAIFSLVSTVLLRPLPFQTPDRLVVLWEDFAATGATGALSRVEPAPASFVEWKARSRSIVDMAALERRVYNLTGAGEPEKLVGLRVTGNLFSLLGLRPVVGRVLTPDDERSQAEPVAVVTEALWRQRFGADPTLVGRTILLNGLAHTVVGVVPGSFRFPDRDAAIWVAASFTPAELASRSAHWYVVGRLETGVTLSEAQSEMTAIARRMAEDDRASNGGLGVTITSLHDQLAGHAGDALLILQSAVGLVLLIACANVASLVVARGASRQRELVLRQILGASRARLFRQLLTESVVLGGLGAVLGVGLCAASFAYLVRLVPEMLPLGSAPALDGRVLAFTTVVSILTVLLSGAGPSLAVVRVDVNQTLRAGGGRGATQATNGRLRQGLVVAEITLTVVLLAAAGLLVRSYAEVTSVRPGFDPQHLLVAETILPPAKYATQPSRTAFYRDVLARVNQSPGVVAAGYVNYPPLTLKEGRGYLTIEGQPAPPLEARSGHVVSWRVISARYLAALGVPLLQGRHLTEGDGLEAPAAVIINQAMARRHWGQADPIGRRLKLGRRDGPAPWCTIVGVVGDIRQMGLEAPAEPEVYFALDQRSGAAPFFWPQHLVVRATGDPLALAPAIRRAVRAVDADQPVSNVRAMSEIIDAELLGRGTQATVVSAFAALAVLLSAIGLYAFLAYEVTQRTSEIGVRMALGAGRSQVVGFVVGRALRCAGAGIALGCACAIALTRVLTSMLFGVAPTDPLTFAAVTTLLMAVALLAACLPAFRAARVDPIAALRSD